MSKYFKDTELEKLFLEWKQMGYSKWSNIEHQAEWSIIEALLDEELNYVGTSNIDYPSFPNDLQQAKRVVAASKEARNVLNGFEVPEKDPNVSLRVFLAKTADDLEKLVAPEIGAVNAAFAADYFLARCLKDSTPDYE